ncbi:TlpA disulfide reductase family protein [Pedobacter sp.]|jgi:thiol-disulfide isomerase/thioredoxin|uniref:TlpA family protein disulfide reductase n=1 Tax=Pedobacter sp. TaxID=1411316 RepID=UPI002CF453C5|nr:TlpA disulfide reductase family protein [Pedobacter sp.]HWW39399.1 TlpA disulfide reductase family protein [Pedobacter sp.]
MIKKTIVMIILCLYAGITFGQKKEATIVVDMASSKIDSMWIVAADEEVIMAKPDKEGKYVHTFTGNFPKSIRMGIDAPKKAQMFLFLEEGNRLNIQTDFGEQTVFTGTGAENNRVLFKYMSAYIDANNKADAKGMSPQQYYAMGHAMDQQSIDILEANKQKVTPVFYSSQSVTLKYQKLGNQIMMPYYYSLGFGKKMSEIIPEGYWDLDKQVEMKEEWLSNDTYKGFIRGNFPAFLGWRELFKQGILDSTTAISMEKKSVQRYRLVEKYYTGKIRSMALNTQINTLFQTVKNVETVKPLMDEYIAKYADSEDAKSLQATYKKILTLAAGKTPPFFVLKDEQGKDVTLKDFAGKVVYMDFWASWCTPCRYEMKNGSPKLHEKFKENKDVVFLYISVDDRADLWKKAIADDKIQGIHLLSKGGMKSPVGKAFNIQGIPRYIIIGKDGKIFDNDAPRPSEDKTPVRINEALSAK